MKSTVAMLLMLSAASFSCQSSSSDKGIVSSLDDVTNETLDDVTNAVRFDPAQFESYGAGVEAGPTTPVEMILADADAYNGETVRVAGEIVSVCQMKGCWVRVGSEEANMFVKFKDYDFFVPLDAEGPIVLEGVVDVSETSVEDQKHFLEDEGKIAEAAAITEPLVQIKLMASGVAIRKDA